MFHFIDHIIKMDDKSLRKLAEKARFRAKFSKNFQFKQNREMLAEACELELKLRNK
jgi:hypothetical protein